MCSTLPRSSRQNKPIKGLPVHCLSEEDIKTEHARGIYPYFHAPENRHSRFMSSITYINKGFLRNIERPATFCHKPLPGGIGSKPSVRPASAPGTHSRSRRLGSEGNITAFSGSGSLGLRDSHHQAAATQATIKAAQQHTTQTGVPCFSVSAVMEADLKEGTPLPGGEQLAERESWRVAKVASVAVPPSRYGHGEAGAKAFHQDYRFYKYYGFAGRGAKTSWASNPKHRTDIEEARKKIPTKDSL